MNACTKYEHSDTQSKQKQSKQCTYQSQLHKYIYFIFPPILFDSPPEMTDEEEVNCIGEKVILREQVKELFNQKYGQCISFIHTVCFIYTSLSEKDYSNLHLSLIFTLSLMITMHDLVKIQPKLKLRSAQN